MSDSDCFTCTVLDRSYFVSQLVVVVTMIKTASVTLIKQEALLSCRRETARRFVLLNILLSHSRSFEMTSLSRTCASPYYFSIETVSISHIVSEILSVKECCDVETGGRGRSRSLKMAPFDRPYTTFYWWAIVSSAASLRQLSFFLAAQRRRSASG